MSDERKYFEELRDATFAKALADGMEIVTPTASQLQLDIDRPWSELLAVDRTDNGNLICVLLHGDEKKRKQIIDRFLVEFQVLKWDAWRSNGGNSHVVITLSCELSHDRRIALQTILGSDPMREFLNLRRSLCGADDPIALFRPPSKG